MTDGISLRQPTTSPANRLYQSEGVREVQSRARYLEQQQTPQERSGLQRLDRLLQQGHQFDGAAPRGYYLNIRV